MNFIQDQFPSVPVTTPAKLPSVTEKDEGQINNADDAKLTTPKSHPSATKFSQSPSVKSNMKTPSTVSSARPPREEMHPSKVHKSTAKKPDSGLILGFQPVTRDSNGKVIKETLSTDTPSKVPSSPLSNMGTPSKFGFKFASDDAKLSEEARKLMESVRGDVARIKAQMVLERKEQQRKQEASETVEGRKIAKPKGKAGRFSEAHIAEFKKMDSIAGHASAYRAQPGRFTPLSKSLKRKSSKALLDESEQKSLPSKSPTVEAKRVKRSEIENPTAIQRPASVVTPRKTAIPQSTRSTFRSSSLMTPTRSSTARFASARASKIAVLSSFTGSPASRVPAAPQTPKTEFNPRLKNSLPSLGNLKSILRRRQPLFSNDPAKIAAGTHIEAPDFNPNVKLTGLPIANFGGVDQTPSPKKRVEFTSSTKSRRESVIPTLVSTHAASDTALAFTSDVVYPTLPEMSTPDKEIIDTPTIRRVRDSNVAPLDASLLQIPAISHGIPNKERKHDGAKHESTTQSPSPKTISAAKSATTSPFPKMPTVPHGITNEKRGRKGQNNQSDAKPSTMLKSISPSPLNARSPSTSLLAVPHGINNKKRHRADLSDDEEENIENVLPSANPSADHKRDAKRLKASPVKMNPVSPSPIKNRHILTPGRMTGNKANIGTPGTASKKGVLSLSRLNMLSKPKFRP